jgi:cytochrome bd-type quinol oxidase subunit 2
MLADDVIDLIALALVIYAIILAVALVLALRAQMRQRLRRAAMLTIWATASLFVVFGLGAAVNDDVHVSKLSTNGVGIIQD